MVQRRTVLTTGLGWMAAGSTQAQATAPALYRPKGGPLKPISSGDALEILAKRLVQVRTNTWQSNHHHGRGLGFLFGTGLTNEEGYLWAKLARILGVAHLELVGETVLRAQAQALESHLGYPAAPNHWTEAPQSKTLVFLGGGLTRPHPLYRLSGLPENRWQIGTGAMPFKAQSLPLKPGTELALLGGWIRYLLAKNRWSEAFVTNFTNGPYQINENFTFQDGLFAGYDRAKQRYQSRSWRYTTDASGQPLQSEDPRTGTTVLQLLTTVYEPYTVAQVSRVTGLAPGVLELFYQNVTNPAQRPLALAYGLEGPLLTESCFRAMAILQLLTGQVGAPGSGLMALAPEDNRQGLMDVGANGSYLPGYRGQVIRTNETYLSWVQQQGVRNLRSLQELIERWYGPQSKQSADWGFSWLPQAPTESLTSALRQARTKILVCLDSDPRSLGSRLDGLETLVLLTSGDTRTLPTQFAGELLIIPLPKKRRGTVTDLGRRVRLTDAQDTPILGLADNLWTSLIEQLKLQDSPDSEHLLKVSWETSTPEGVLKAITNPPENNFYGNLTTLGWSWPENIRVLYNRASADLTGKGTYLAWNEAQNKWQGSDVPDIDATAGPATREGGIAFRQTAEGVGRLVAVDYGAGLNLDTGIAFRHSPTPILGPLPLFPGKQFHTQIPVVKP